MTTAVATTTTKAKATKGKKKTGKNEAVSGSQTIKEDAPVAENHTEIEMESDVEEPIPVKKTRAKSKKEKKEQKATAKSKGKQKVTDEPEAEEIVAAESGIEAPTESEAEPAQKPEKKTRAKAATTAKGRKKAQNKEVEEEEDSKAGTEVGVPSGSEAELPADEQPTPKVIRPASKASASKSSKSSSRLKALPSLPPSHQPPPVKSPTPSSRPLSQLDRFANIPPTSSPASTPRGKATLRSTRPTKLSPHAALPREAMDASLTRGALAARKVVDDLFSSPAGASSTMEEMSQPKQTQEPHLPSQPRPLTEQEKQMKLEALIRAEMQRSYNQLKEEGEKMIEDWYEKAKNDRKKIESL